MKPLNSNDTGCNPISSNCVIWQGPTIPCIKLCKGDTVSDTVFKLATELCDVLNTLDINTYDISCLNLTGCAPEDFQGLVQLLIETICKINDLDPPIGGSDRESITTEVPIASCFVYTNEYGDKVTTMPMDLYVRTIGNRICDLINQINSINALLVNHETRIVALEETPPPTFALSNITPSCVLPSVPTDIYSEIIALEKQFCELRSSTGLPNDIYQGISKQCVNLNASDALGPYGGTMSSLSGWINTVTNLAQSYTNLWLTVCDLRAAIQNIQLTCCPTGCDGISIMITTQLTGSNLVIYLTGVIPMGFENCNPAGSLFTITDANGGAYAVRIDVVNQLNVPAGTVVALSGTPINLLSDILTDAVICLTNPSTNATCEICIDYAARSQSNCPSLVINVTTDTSISYSYAVIYVPGNYTVELWNAAGTAVIASTTTAVAVASTINGSFTGLSTSTVYKIRIVTDIGGNVTECAFVSVTTLPVVCYPPTAVDAAFTIPTECPDCGPAIDFVSAASVDGWYVDDDSPFLRLYTSGSFNDFFRVLPDTNTVGLASGDPNGRNICYINDPTATHGFHGFHVVNDRASGVAGTGSLVFINDVTIITTVPLAGSIVPPRTMCYDPNNGGRLYFTWSNSGKIGYVDLNTLTVTGDIGVALPMSIPLQILYNPFNGYKYTHGSTGGLNFGVTIIDELDVIVGTISYAMAGFYNQYGARLCVNTNNGEVWFTLPCNTTAPDAPGEIDIIDPVTSLVTATVTIDFRFVPVNTSNTTNIITYNPTNNSMYVGVQDACAPIGGKIIQILAIAPYSQVDFVNPTPAYPICVLWTDLFSKLVMEDNSDTNTTYDINGVEISSIAFTGRWYVTEDVVYNHLIAVNGLGAANVEYLGLDTDEVISCSSGIVDMYLGGNTGPYSYNDQTTSWDSYCTYSSVIDNMDGTITITAILLNNATAIFMYSTDLGLTWLPLDGFYTAAEWALGITFTVATPLIFRLAILTDTNCGLAGAINSDLNP